MIRGISFLLLLFCAAPACACQVSLRAQVPVAIEQGLFVVTASIDGRPARLVLDTGAERSVLTDAAVRRLGLALDPWVGSTLRGVGGIERHQDAAADSIRLGGIRLRQSPLSRYDYFAVGSLNAKLAGVDGLLGHDFLSHFDLDLDGPGKRFSLYDVAGCRGRFLPWHVRYTSIAAEPAYRRELVIPVTINGETLRSVLDTGTSISLLIAPGMVRLGLPLAGPVRGTPQVLAGIGQYPPMVYRVRFATMRVGNETIEHPTLAVAPLRLHFDMLLGTDWLRPRRVWVSYPTMQVFVAEQ